MKQFRYFALMAIVCFLLSFGDAHAQIWELANKTHHSTSIIPGEGKVVFSISNHLFFSSDMGKTFTVDEGGSSNNINGFAIGSVGKYYFSSPSGLFSSPAYSDMNNENWERIDSSKVPTISSLFVRAGKGIVASDEIYVGTAAGLWRSESGGTTWVKLHDAKDGLAILQVAAHNENIYYRTLTTVWASHDGGTNWKSIAASVTNGNKTSIVTTTDNDLYIAVSGFPGSHILHSTDGGNSFNGFRGIDFGTRTIQALTVSEAGDLYLAGGVRDAKQDSITQGYAYVFLHDAFGWVDFSLGLPSTRPAPEVIGLGFSTNGNVFAGTDSAGLWRTLLPNKVSMSSALAGISLSQNYPNPANSYTEFSVTSDHYAKATLILVDALGRTVTNISNNDVTSGNHFYKVETASLPNGTYFYRLQTPEGFISRSFIIAR